MKSLILMGALLLLSMVSCNTSNNNKINKDKPLSEIDSLELEARVEEQMDSLKKTFPNMVAEKNEELISKSISIINYYTSKPNSAGGVDCNIIWKNNSDKTVKYIHFSVAPFNSVDDMVESEIGGTTYQKITVTGPIKPNTTHGYGTYWECIWYNSTISYMKITGIKIEYMDGSIISTNNIDLINQSITKNKK
jgi:hypothetical protein